MLNHVSWLRALCIATATFFVAAGSAQAWSAHAVVLCDINENGQIDSADPSIENVLVRVENVGTTFAGSATTDSTGDAWIDLPDFPDTYAMSLDPASLPSDAVVVIPAGGTAFFSTTVSATADSAAAGSGGSSMTATAPDFSASTSFAFAFARGLGLRSFTFFKSTFAVLSTVPPCSPSLNHSRTVSPNPTDTVLMWFFTSRPSA